MLEFTVAQFIGYKEIKGEKMWQGAVPAIIKFNDGNNGKVCFMSLSPKDAEDAERINNAVYNYLKIK